MKWLPNDSVYVMHAHDSAKISDFRDITERI